MARKQKRRGPARAWLLLAALAGLALWQYLVPSGDITDWLVRLGAMLGLMLLLPPLGRLLCRWRRRLRYLNSGLAQIDVMSGVEFEEFLAAYFTSLGYEVESTPASNDYGADLLCRGRGELIAVQAKRYSGTVGVKAVQELLGGLAYYQADRGLVISNAYFSRQAWQLAESGPVELWDREALQDFCHLKG